MGWLVVFGAAFGYLEAAVVVYLREIYSPGGFAFPLDLPENRALWVELGREAATLVMLGGVAMLSGRGGWSRFGAFSVLFGVWDLVFYLGLRVVLGWPESLLTWDVLFLLPRVWTGPVLAPVLVALSLWLAGSLIMVRAEGGRRPNTAWWVWAGAVLSLGLLLGAFMANHDLVRSGGVPVAFPWGVYLGGLLLGWGAFWAAFARNPHPGPRAENSS